MSESPDPLAVTADDHRPEGAPPPEEAGLSPEAVLATIRGLSAEDRGRLEAAYAALRRDVERRARASEEGLRLALEAGRMGTWEWDVASGVQIWSPELVRLLGLAPGPRTYTAEAFYRLVHPDDLPAIKAWADHAAAEGRDYIEDEFRIVRPDGAVVWVASRTRLHRDHQGRIVRMTGVNMDVTPRKATEESLRRSEERFSTAFAASPDGLVISQADDGTITEVNASFLKIFGLRREEAIGRRSTELGLFADPADRERAMRIMAAEGHVRDLELLVRRRSGEQRVAQLSAEMIDVGGEPFLLSILRDITERKADAEAVRESEARLAAFMEHSPGSIFIKDAAGRYMVVNHAFLTMAERSAEEVIGKTDHELYAPELADMFVAEDAEVRASGQARRYEASFVYNGRTYTFLSHKFPLPGGGIGCVGTDITERKAAEVVLREAQERRLAEEQRHAARLQRLNASSLAINAAPTRDEALRLIADEARALVGAGQAVVTLVPRGDWARAQTAASLADPRAAPPAVDDEIRRLVYAQRRTVRRSAAQRGGGELGGDVLAAPLLDADGVSTGLIQAVGKADGPFTAADEALLQQLAQIAAIALENQTLYEQEQAARAQAEEANRLKDEFLGVVSHELRTPLTSFLGYAQLLQRGRRDEAFLTRTLDQMLRSAKAQAQLIEDLLDVSRIVSGKLRIEARPVELAAVIDAALDTVRPAVDAKGLRLTVGVEPGVGAVIGDANRLQQVVWNLLSNAAKFTPPGGRIAVRLERRGREAQLSVSDTGQGIGADFLPFVFERFRQADSTSLRAHGGLGLGLAIVRHLVELHGGTVRADSAGQDRGATFTVRLPLALPGAAPTADDPLPEGGAADDDCPDELAGLRVLIVDDQPAILMLLQDILTPCGALIRTCASAREALAALADWRPDVLVSDIAMPDEDGYWLIGHVRALPPEEGGSIPAVALTAYVRIEERLQVLAAGFQLYIPKPIEPAELRAVLARIVRPLSDY